MKLGSTHEQPDLPHERIILLSVEPFNIFGSLLSVFIPHGMTPNAVQFDCFLTLFYCFFEASLPQTTTCFVANCVQRKHLCEVIFVAFLTL